MVVFFFDTSAIIKRYIDETGTPWVQAVADSAANQIYLAGISAVEVTSALARRLPARNISATDVAAVLARFRQDRSLDYRIIDTTPAILADAERLAEAHALRANDAIQLASAVGLRAK
ncbi:MAG TPA: type II toxin-antitoxin system VapC family toxin, partial [Gemmataceae bacterium]|nr:type II toxin-antitoxin system VapC family toxin [Gemmataceae bacterium]